MKKIVALVYGGDSSEAEVSIKSGKHVARHIDREKYEFFEVLIKGRDWGVQMEDGSVIQIDKADFSFVEKNGRRVNFDIALIMIHGTPGENGILEAYFEMIGLPSTTCSSIVSAITFDKYACKCYLRDTGILLAREVFMRKGDPYSVEDIISRLGLPLFVKPNSGGSSFGVTKVKRAEDLKNAIDAAFTEGETILIEECINGREMTNGVFEADGALVRLPVTEIISKNEFFDYEAKYLGASQEICPAAIPDHLSNKIIDISHKMYHYLGCKGIVRMDYIVRGEDVYFLEINTVPGMTEMSLVPQQVRAAGMTIKEFLTKLLG
ncbi:MAG: D-alanine--D-alanine ligase [Bacteroidales bacterium]|jgi:D-alanine-D-alanine ligase